MSFYQQKLFQPYLKYARETHKFRPQQFNNYNRQEMSRRGRQYQESPSQGDLSKDDMPEFVRSPSKTNKNQRDESQPIWEHLYTQGIKSKQELVIRHENNKNKIDLQCTFQPIIKHNKRYLASSNSTFLERINIWQENKIQKMVRQKEEEINNDLKECTFVPKINAKRYEDEVEFIPNKQSKVANVKVNRQINPYYSPLKVITNRPKNNFERTPVKRQFNQKQISEVKRMIKNQLKKLQI